MYLKDFKRDMLENESVKKEYERFDLAFEISQMLIEARIIKGITQDKLAMLVGTKQSGVARAENGASLPSLTFLNKIAKAFKTRLIVRFAFMENSQVSITSNLMDYHKDSDKSIRLDDKETLTYTSSNNPVPTTTFPFTIGGKSC